MSEAAWAVAHAQMTFINRPGPLQKLHDSIGDVWLAKSGSRAPQAPPYQLGEVVGCDDFWESAVLDQLREHTRNPYSHRSEKISCL